MTVSACVSVGVHLRFPSLRIICTDIDLGHSRVEEVSFLLACSSIMLMLSSRMLPSLNSVHSSGFMQTAFSLSSGLVLLPVVLTTG